MQEQNPHGPAPGRKPSLQHVPAILTGAAALIAALTTVYVNVRGDKAAPAPAAEAAKSAVDASRAGAPASADPFPRGADERVRLTVERIAVEHDGSPGTTDWRFTVEADGEPVFAFQQDGLDDHGGRNIARPDDTHAAGALRLAGKPVHIVIKGWRGSWFRTGADPDATGEGVLLPSGSIPPLRVQAETGEAGAFVFYLSAEAETSS